MHLVSECLRIVSLVLSSECTLQTCTLYSPAVHNSSAFVRNRKDKMDPFHFIHEKGLCDRTQPPLWVLSQQLINLTPNVQVFQKADHYAFEGELCV